MHRFFVENVSGDTAVITGEDVRHIGRVLRLSAGDGVELSDGRGRECAGTIRSVSDQEVCVSCGAWVLSPGEPAHEVTLLQGVPKSGKMEWIIQKCVELGVCSIVPVRMARCVAQPGKDDEGKLTRYRRVALEAAKQSRRGRIPDIGPFVRLDRVELSTYDSILVADEEEREVSLKRALFRGVGRRIALVIGPEGGLERGEVQTLTAQGAVPVSLGRRILRTETAGAAMLAEVLYEVEP